MRVKSQDHACATLPVTAPSGEVFGAVNFSFDDPHYFTDEERDLIGAAGGHCAEAIAAAKRLEAWTKSSCGVASPNPSPPSATFRRCRRWQA